MYDLCDKLDEIEHRRALRERLICAALTGLMRQTTAPEPWYAERAISQADAVLAALDREAAK